MNDNLLSKESSSGFIDLNKTIVPSFSEKNVNVEEIINGNDNYTHINGNERKYAYKKSSITIIDANFSKTYAFHAGTVESGSGGSVFVTFSSLLIQGSSRFTSNLATIGGAICCFNSATYIDGLTDKAFENNIAYKYGGAIYFQRIIPKDINNTTKLIIRCKEDFDSIEENGNIYSYNFLNNNAGSIGGAIFIQYCSITSFEKCYFQNNTADIKVGAIASLNSNLDCKNCIFNKNIAALLLIKHKFFF